MDQGLFLFSMRGSDRGSKSFPGGSHSTTVRALFLPRLRASTITFGTRYLMNMEPIDAALKECHSTDRPVIAKIARKYGIHRTVTVSYYTK